jgi:hypothetical protein
MSVLQKLTEGIVERSLEREGSALLEKWERTGLLEGLNSDKHKSTMARLLENQAAQLLKEASSMAGGDVEGFASVAFPIVRRVFGGLIANDLVSVQPMSLPSGLIFFLDFQHTNARLHAAAADSLYGGGVVGQELTGGVDLGETDPANAEKGYYNLSNGYSSPTASNPVTINSDQESKVLFSGTVGLHVNGLSGSSAAGDDFHRVMDGILRSDPDFTDSTTTYAIAEINVSDLQATGKDLNKDNLIAVIASGSHGNAGLGKFGVGVNPGTTQSGHVRRLNQFSGSTTTKILVVNASNAGATTADVLSGAFVGAQPFHYPVKDNFAGTPAAGTSNALGAVVGTDTWGLENDEGIPEIDIKVDSISVTAVTKKLKAKWTPELGQDLNAYHNLDAEVELTSILSEQIALEIDREILADLVNGATADTMHWSRRPGKFVNRSTGKPVNVLGAGSDDTDEGGPEFTGTVSEWYETLVETINDVSAQIHRKTLRGGANFIVVSPEVANILEFTSGFRASVTHDADKGTVGAVKVGALSKKWDVYVDPYFMRNVVLVGRKGSSFLESGYVYAPYVPLQVTPTIFGVEDFVPRKGVMTRYAKKMVRPDMYGLVICGDLLG